VGKIFSVKLKDISLYGQSRKIFLKSFCNKIAKKNKTKIFEENSKKKPKFL
jgi:hypothetical protein